MDQTTKTDKKTYKKFFKFKLFYRKKITPKQYNQNPF